MSRTDGRVAWKPAARRIWMMGGRRRALWRLGLDIVYRTDCRVLFRETIYVDIVLNEKERWSESVGECRGDH